MSLGQSLASHPLKPLATRLPWQFRVRPALFATVSVIVAVLLAVGGLILTRRLTGALSADLSHSLMLALAIISAATLAFARLAWRRSFPLETPADLSVADQVLGWASSAALAMLALGCCYPANRTADWLIWLPVLVADQLWRQNFFDAGEPWVPSTESEIESSTASTLAIAESPHHDNIVQQLYRLQDAHGTEVIYGTVRADFVAGQRTAVGPRRVLPAANLSSRN